MKATSMQNLAIIFHRGNAYRVNFAFMSKNDALSIIMSFYPNKRFAKFNDVSVFCVLIWCL